VRVQIDDLMKKTALADLARKPQRRKQKRASGS